MILKSDEEEVFEGEGASKVEVNPNVGVCRQGVRETLEAFFQGIDSKCQVRGMTVGFLVESLQQHLNLPEEDAEQVVDLLGGDLFALIGKEAFVERALGWWETQENDGEEVFEKMAEEEIQGNERFQNQLDISYVRRSSLSHGNVEDLHFLEEQKVDLEERLRLSGEVEEQWRRRYFAKADQWEQEEARFFYFLLILNIKCCNEHY